ncbi:hypothetical protein P8C59_000238 [Phyllachora maydis]|uniref:Reverse transcriptase Ty1/copia-type domain-containing protein n=1 Tax=Phyllachora maydis TaxID=1825666 RepID=A0AAD9HWU9_9PEZI|nr:hypothetical protein P8C59_000238 [Phyllachora maydis]
MSNIDFFSDLDDLVYTILGISTAPLALAPILAKPAKITPAIRCTAAYKAKRRELAKACAAAGRAAAAKRYKKRKEACSKRTASSDAGRYTTNSGLTANKDDNNAYNGAYMPPADIEEEEEGGSSDNNGINSGTSDSANKGEGSGAYEYGESALRYEAAPTFSWVCCSVSISKDSKPTTYKQVLKLPRDKHSKWLEAITKEFIQLLELGVFKFLSRSLLPSNYKLITYRNVLKVKKDAKNRPIKLKSQEEIYIEIPKGLLDLAASNTIYKLLLKYSYNPSTPNIIKLSKALYSLKQSPRESRGPDIGYITDLKKRLNKVYAIEDLGPAAYFLGMQIKRDRPNRCLWLNQPTKSHLNAAKNLFKYLNSTKDYSICFSYNGNTVADLGPKLSNSSNITTKLSRDFHSKEGPRLLTTTSTTIVDSRNGKVSSRTSIINSSLVPVGLSDSDFTGDKATSKSTYGYLYKLAGRPISWKTKRATTITLSTLEAETNRLIEAIRKVQTKHTLLKFQYVREQVKAKIVKAKIVTIIFFNTKFNSTGYFTAL